MDIRTFRRKHNPQVNIVPMVDVLTVLIFFFLLTMQFKEIYAVDITPPSMKASDQIVKEKPVVVAISEDGGYFIGKERFSKDELAKKMEELAARSSDEGFVLLADEKTPLSFVTDAIDVMKLAKIKKLSLQTNKLN